MKLSTIKETVHIRKPLTRKGGNQFYRDRRERKVETLCGAPVTAHDIPKLTAPSLAWFGEQLCRECIEKAGR